MKIIDAYWEKRNIGMDASEIIIEKKDLLDKDNVLSTIRNIIVDPKYIVIKIPVSELSFLHSLEKIGFNFMECQYQISRNLKDYSPPEVFSSLLEEVTTVSIDKNSQQLNWLLGNIETDMFSTDRIYLDPTFPSGTASLRYKNWIKDIFFNDQTMCFNVIKNNVSVGFGIAKIDECKGDVQNILGGCWKSYQGLGLGPAFIHAPFLYFRNKAKRIITNISSNNIAVFRLYSLFSYRVDKACYVLRHTPIEK
jgi:hypothetical protein